LANNADRKITHCLLSSSGKVVGIDDGLTFHPEPKLRTVMWQFVGQPIRGELRGDLENLMGRREELVAQLADVLVPEEIEALWERAETLMSTGVYPQL